MINQGLFVIMPYLRGDFLSFPNFFSSFSLGRKGFADWGLRKYIFRRSLGLRKAEKIGAAGESAKMQADLEPIFALQPPQLQVGIHWMQQASMALAQPPFHQMVPLAPPSRVLLIHNPGLTDADLEHIFSHYKGFRRIWRNTEIFQLIEFGTGPQAVLALQDAVSTYSLNIFFAGQNHVNGIEAQLRNHIETEMILTITVTLKLPLSSGFDEYKEYLQSTRRVWLTWEDDIMKNLFRPIQDERARQRHIVEYAAIHFLLNPQPHVALIWSNFKHSLHGRADLPWFVDFAYANDYFEHCKSVLGL